MKIKNFLSAFPLILLISINLVLLYKLQFFNMERVGKTTFFDNSKETERKIVTADNTQIEDFLKDTMIDINTASKEDILKIDGITDDTAKRIVNLRKYQKKIRKFEDLLKIKSMTKSEYQIICTNFYIE